MLGAMKTAGEPPKAPKRPTELRHHGDVRIDNWYWLREKDNPEVIAHLEAENAHTAAVMTDTQGIQERLFEEIRSRIQETDLSVPVRRNGWLYYSRTEEGEQYGIHCRKRDDGAPEQVLLDENKEAAEGDFYELGTFDISPDGNLLMHSADRDGAEIYTLRVRNLETGEDLDTIENTYYGSAWSRDGSVLFYTRPDDAMRPYQVWRHVVGTPADQDVIVFEEGDERFFVGVGNSKTDDYIVISVGSSLTSEVLVLDADDPMGVFAVVEPRRQGIEYDIAHWRGDDGDCFYILTNEDAPNFKLMVTGTNQLGRENWREIIAHREDVKLDGVETFRNFLILSERAEATARVTLFDLATNEMSVIEQSETVYTAHSSGNAEFDTNTVRFSYTSFVTPNTVFEIDVASGERKVLKRQPVLGTFNSDEYTTERLWATAEDGTQIPISIVYRKDREGAGPTLLYGYGSYEISIDPTFSSLRLSLLDRGFAFAIAHIRGGGDMGRLWYEHGKFNEKMNTFTDFIACAEHLVDNGYTRPEELSIRGGSAGGLLMGAVTNLRPDLFGAVVAEVPFVDALTTMLDPSLPLTVHEYEEWGNPEEESVYRYMKSYSPVDNVEAKSYPPILITAGLNDPRVSYWEPAKWAQKLRDLKTDNNEVLLKTEMGAGHQGPSGRYDAWRDEAFIYAFIFKALKQKVLF
jgi:oligopeptidase B